MTDVVVSTPSTQKTVVRQQPRVVVSERVRLDLDTARMVNGETPTPATNGVQTVFTTAYPYVPGTLHVTRGSLRLHPTVDYSETSSALGTFTLQVAPESTEPLITDYIKA